ncbi:HEXXH motif-containing putative peptide modification protein (plasmid) [Streptomyces clavifer]|uniref:aKG-HExxH-type peptide beta-hydroxylase n=1 Tax=Streptomyces clavifer TaxID=68188 RepID=UPI002E81D033|nr:HEXXH motif-containing putative peptide modification protein [Streptomyces clavifer]WUC32471.1 HEXXH motif-containing putative peptide modification protein [Streptomyces clavifer]
MLVPALDFVLAPVRDLYRDRVSRIHTALQSGSAPARSTATVYCLAHHALEGAEIAARAGDTATFDWYRAHPDAKASALSTPTVVGPRIVVSPGLEDMLRSPLSETPYYLLGPDTAAAPGEERELASAAYDMGARAGFAGLLADHAVVACLLRRKNLGDTLISWSVTRLPGTVFCDHVGEPAVLGRDLIHEAGHNWFNDALTATARNISEETTFYSPWRKTRRPAFGFLHACWAFPLTMIYTTRVLPDTDGPTHDFLAAYLEQQRGLLAATAEDHTRALALITDPTLRQRLHTVHDEALNL